MSSKLPLDLLQMDRAALEALDHAQLVELVCRLRTIAVEATERLALDSTNSSRPPSSDPPFGPSGDGGTGDGGTAGCGSRAASARPPKAPSGRKPGKQPGAKGKWRDEPLKTERSQSHWPAACAQCGTPLEPWDAVVGTAEAFPVLELERAAGGIRIACVEHRYAVVRCACGHATAARPGTGALSFLDGRRRQLQLSERSLVGPSLAAFIAALGLRHHQSRRRIHELLITWFGVSLSVGTIDRCLREVGVACEPIVEDLLDEVRAAGVIHADETPWHQGILGRWLWVVLTATTAVFHIGSRRPSRLAGHRWLWSVSRLWAAPALPGPPDPQGGGPGRRPQPGRRPLRRMAGARTAQPDPGGGRRPRPYHPQPDPGPAETGLQAPSRSRHRENPPTRP